MYHFSVTQRQIEQKELDSVPVILELDQSSNIEILQKTNGKIFI